MPKKTRTNWKKLYLETMAAHERFHQHATMQLTSYLGKVRHYEETLCSNNVTITELQQQLAVQAKMLAEAQQDGANAIAAHNKMVTWLREAVTRRDDAELEITQLEYKLADARLRLGYRIWHALTIWAAKTRVTVRLWWARRVERYQAWRKIRRLSAQRIAALNDAGYIPRDLVKMAIKYHEYDQQQVQNQRSVYDYAGMQAIGKFKKPSIWRRLGDWVVLMTCRP